MLPCLPCGDFNIISQSRSVVKWFLKKIKSFIKEDDTVICLGDCCDRGPDGIKIMQEILNDSRFIYLMGNHESMLIDAIEKNLLEDKPFDNYDLYILKHNGTLPTLEAYQSLSQDEQKTLFQKLVTLPSLAVHKTKDNKDVFLCHAGANAETIWNENTEEKTLQWNRKHIATEKWNPNYPNTYVIHGHTPVPAMGYYNKEYQKILDNFDALIFESIDKINEYMHYSKRSKQIKINEINKIIEEKLNSKIHAKHPINKL